MDGQTLLGCLIAALALGAMTALLIWSQRSINRIARSGFGSAREIAKDQDRGG